MKYRINWGCSDGVFAVPDLAADCLKLASGKAVKTLLYILKNKATDVPPADIAKAVGITEEDAEDALSYWQQVGLIITGENAPEQPAAPVVPAARRAPESKPADALSSSRAREKAAKMISPKEIAERTESSEEIRVLFSAAESIFGKVLSYTEQRTLIWVHDYYGIGTDLLMMIMEFAKSQNRAGMRFIEKIAENWHSDGVSTHEQAERELLRMQNYYSLSGQVRARLGLERTLTPAEKKYVNDWASKNIGIELIVYAYEKTVDQLGKVKFSYMNAILLDWYGKGCFTAADVKSMEEKGAAKPSAADTADSGEHSYNLDLLVEHALVTAPKIKR